MGSFGLNNVFETQKTFLEVLRLAKFYIFSSKINLMKFYDSLCRFILDQICVLHYDSFTDLTFQ